MSALKRITESGVSYAEARSEKRNIVLTNYISLVAAGATLSLLIGRFLFAHVNFSIALTLMQGCILFLLPVLLNRFGFVNASRLALCWLPPVHQLYATLQTMKEVSEFETSTYVGLRFFILAFGCFPFLVFDLRRKALFVSGLAGPLLFLLSYDPLLTFFGVGYWQMGLHDPTYQFNNVRAFISVLIIGSSSFFLKRLVGQSDELNTLLIDELADKNKVIQQQAADEVHRLNQQLLTRLQQSADRELILNQSQRIAKIGSWEYRPKGTVLFLSDEMYNIFGLDRTFNFKTTNLPEIWGEQRAILTQATLELIRTGAPCDLTLRVRTPLGYIKRLRFYGFPLREGDTVIGAMGICHDITLYKEAEELLRTRENKYRSLFEQASDFIMILDFNGNFIDANASLYNAFGYSKEELMGLKIEALIDPEQLKEQPIRYKELDRGDHVFSHRRMMYKNGTIIDVESNVKKMQEGQMLVIARDVTKLREVQKLIQLSEARFRGAFEYSATGMSLVSLEGKWLKVNKELCHIVGYPEEELLTLTFQEITHPADLDKDLTLFQQTLHGEIGPYRIEKRYIHKNGNSVWVNLNVSLINDDLGNALYFVAQVEDITERKNAEAEKEHARYLLNERIKELTTLYQTGQILQAEQISIETALQEIVSILPAGWQYPEIAAARIEVDGIKFSTSNFSNGSHRQSAEFRTAQGTTGIVEVVYLEEKPLEREGPFLAEERTLLNMLAEMLRIYLSRTHGEDALKQSEANLNATINNTGMLIWSVDRNYRLITFNKPFFNYIKEIYGSEIRGGDRVLGDIDTPENHQLNKKWEQHYLRALSGEVLSLEETRFGLDFQYSLSPIIEGDQIIGVSAFADNITERKARDRALIEANKKVGELKLMALRSVMSPHFIFNVLNSIQFFIAKNDRLNAINYLSTFSKLIRSILTHSVTNKISLAEEIEMLNNYVELEMTRFENKFTFALQVDPEMDKDAIEIPSLLIQPYVENAILHGLYNKTGPGTLLIRIHEHDEAVIFEIEDDGIGREAAMKLSEQNFPTHKSMGIQLTEERLKLINQQQHAALEIEDLVRENRACGTRVRIRVPF